MKEMLPSSYTIVFSCRETHQLSMTSSRRTEAGRKLDHGGLPNLVASSLPRKHLALLSGSSHHISQARRLGCSGLSKPSCFVDEDTADRHLVPADAFESENAKATVRQTMLTAKRNA